MKNIKQLLLPLLLIIAVTTSEAQVQPDPAHWAYALKKISGSNYEVHFQCTIDEGWHIYAQKQGPDFIGTKTKIALAKTPGLTLNGIPKEVGKKDTYTDKTVGITNYEYAGKVDFVQKVTIAPGVKEIKGKVYYQTCTHKQCLPETSVDFTIPVPQN